MQSCGGCKYFYKRKNDEYSGGICTLKDARTNTDGGHKCDMFKRFKFHKANTSEVVS